MALWLLEAWRAYLLYGLGERQMITNKEVL